MFIYWNNVYILYMSGDSNWWCTVQYMYRVHQHLHSHIHLQITRFLLATLCHVRFHPVLVTVDSLISIKTLPVFPFSYCLHCPHYDKQDSWLIYYKAMFKCIKQDYITDCILWNVTKFYFILQHVYLNFIIIFN